MKKGTGFVKKSIAVALSVAMLFSSVELPVLAAGNSEEEAAVNLTAPEPGQPESANAINPTVAGLEQPEEANAVNSSIAETGQSEETAGGKGAAQEGQKSAQEESNGASEIPAAAVGEPAEGGDAAVEADTPAEMLDQTEADAADGADKQAEVPEQEKIEAQAASEEPAPETEEGGAGAGEEEIEASGPWGDNLTWTFYKNGTLVISGEGLMNSFSSSNSTDAWRTYSASITSVELDEDITTISNYAFYGCESLPEISFPAGVTSIGDYAFYGCVSLTDLEFPAGLRVLGISTFEGCNSLTDVELPKSFRSWGYNVFANCKKFKSIVIPEDVTFIPDGAFKNDNALKKVTIPASLKSVGYGAFSSSASFGVNYGGSDETWAKIIIQNDNLLLRTALRANKYYRINYHLNDGINSPNNPEWYCVDDDPIILEDATREGYIFEGWFSNMQTPSRIRVLRSGYLGEYELYARWLEPIEWGNLSWNYNSVTKTLTFSGDGDMDALSSDWWTKEAWRVYSNEAEHIVINDGVTSIGDYAFYNFNRIYSIELPSSLKRIGKCAFKGSYMYSIEIPDSVTDIGEEAFYDSYLKSIKLPVGLKSISSGLFRDCSLLESIELPAGITSIGVSAFYNCSRLKSVVLPESVKSIGSYAFYDCSLIESIEIPSGVTSIANNTFEYCGGLIEVSIPASVKTIGDCAFDRCRALQYVYYDGLQSAWKAINISTYNSGNYYLQRAELICSTYAISYDLCGGTNNSANPSVYRSDGDTIILAEPTKKDATFVGWFGDDKYTTPVTEIESGSRGEKTFYAKWVYRGEYENLTWELGSDGVLKIYGDGEMKDFQRYPLEAWAACTSEIYSVVFLGNVTSIGNRAFYACQNLTEIVIPNTVTRIGDDAFYQCASLESIVLPDGVEVIGKNTFYECSSLQSVTLPAQAESIGECAFYSCRSLENITFPKNLKSIGKNAFYGCLGLTSIEIPEGVQNIEDSVFEGCSNLCSVTLPKNLAGINERAFYNCSSLTGITLPDGIAGIGARAFSGCSSLTDITLPNGVTSIGAGAFSACSSLTGIILPNGVASVEESTFYNCSSLTGITLPDGVISIGASAFISCSSLTAITLPDSVTSIGNNAFERCIALKSITLPKSLTKIESYTFNLCDALESVTIPDRVTSIGDNAFFNCKKLVNVTLPKNITSLGNCVFYGCTSIQSITVPGNEARLGYSLFSGCTALEKVVIEPGVVSLGTSTFYSCKNLESVIIPDSVTSIGGGSFDGCDQNKLRIQLSISGDSISQDYTGESYGTWSARNRYWSCYDTMLKFISKVTITGQPKKIGNYTLINCTNLEEVIIPESVERIGDYAFYGCTKLKEIIIPESMKRIGSYAFQQCSSLTDITLPDRVTSIGEFAFYYCSGLTDVVIPAGVTSIEQLTFYGCRNLTYVSIPDGVTSIGANAFNSCSKLKNVTIPESVTTLGTAAFASCTSITSFTIPSSVTNISGGAISFGNNDAVIELKIKAEKVSHNYASDTDLDRYWYSYTSGVITKVTIDGDITHIGDCAFMACTKLTDFHVPDGVESIGGNAFNSCSSMTSIYIPASVTSIGSEEIQAFSSCNSLKAVYYGGTEADWAAIVMNSADRELLDEIVICGSSAIVYHLNGGTNHEENPVMYDAEENAVTLKGPSRDGYIFGGWYSEAAFETKVTEIPKGSTGAIAVYAKWTPITYTVRFDGNGASSGSMEAMRCTYDVRYTLPANQFAKKGYLFAGWNTEADESGADYADGAGFRNLAEDDGAAVTLYAQWEDDESEDPGDDPDPGEDPGAGEDPAPGPAENPDPAPAPEPVEPAVITYKIVYSLCGGTNDPANPDSYEMTEDAIKLAAPARTGYDFAGWCTDTALTKRVTQIAAGTRGDIVLYAKWTPHRYTIKFDGNGASSGSMSAMTKRLYGTRYELSLNKYKKSGSIFTGWNTKADGTGTAYGNKCAVENLTDTDGDTVVLYAQWRDSGYTVTYYLNGGLNHAENPSWYDEDMETIVLKAPTKEGFTFDGWYSDAKCRKPAAEIVKGSTGNLKFYAKWTAGRYDVVFDGNGADRGTMNSLSGKAYGKKFKLTANKFKRTGYTFAGWNTEKDGSGIPYKNKASVSNLNGGTKTSVTLYAQWDAVKYKVVYKLKKGKNDPDNPAYYIITDNTIELAEPVRSGYTFAGWYSDSKCKKPAPEIPKGSTGKKTFYAKWVKQ